MTNSVKLKLFISYSHSDEENIKEFAKHLAPLKNKGLIEDWYDRKIIAGNEFQEHIDSRLDEADIICLVVSANFLSSPACIKEKNQALNLKRKKGIAVIPVILSPCGWLDDEISSLLALPTDGQPITSFVDRDQGWNIVYNGLKKVIEEMISIKQLKITEKFAEFLQDTDLLSKAHSQKDRVRLDDIFIYPELAKYDEMRDFEKNVKSEILLEEYGDPFKIVIAGEDQSGKTALCKKLFEDLRSKGYVPVYVSDKAGKLEGKIDNKIMRAFSEQYDNTSYEKTFLDNINKKRFVPIIDDFHIATKKEDHISDLAVYRNQVLVVDDIFCLNLRDERLIRSFSHFRIRELKASYRYKLIRRWTHLTDKSCSISHGVDNVVYQTIDTATELVDSALGKVIGTGIMPAYPFFILSVMSTYETLEKPLDQEITSQGYCYQALIYMYLRKQGVKNDEIDTYINFLSEFAFWFFKEKKHELAPQEFGAFMEKYSETYHLPIAKDTLLSKLLATQIITQDSFNNYSFEYPYLYYFFVAKFLSEHRESQSDTIFTIITNLHKDENAYIAIFISHHSKNTKFLEDIILNSMYLFEKYKPATLSKGELSFFDKQVSVIVDAVLPPMDSTPEKERAQRLAKEDASEQIESKQKDGQSPEGKGNGDGDYLERELRRSIKSVEVMGQIIKNRAGSLKKEDVENIFAEAMRTILRVLSSFFEIIQSENAQKEIVDFISARVEKFIDENNEKKAQDKRKKPSREQLEKLSENIFWNTNFTVVYCFINKIIHSLGSNKLIAIVEKVCDAENTPASFLVKHGILMWYNKNMQIDSIAAELSKKEISEITKKIMKNMIVNHCAIHSVNYKDKQKIENKIGIPVQKLLTNNMRQEKA